MSDPDTSSDLIQRIIKTLQIVEERGYNLTIQRLAKILIGGEVESSSIIKIIETCSLFDFDGTFISTSGNIHSEKCLERLKKHHSLYPIYNKIATEFIDECVTHCPWIHCIMLTGSMASEGLFDGDDIDLNIVVEKDTKYATWLLGLLLSIKYAIKYRKQFNLKWYNLIKGVICICVIWDTSQVFPFVRKDKQIAYELLLNSNVLYNADFYEQILKKNDWIKQWFPQLYGVTFSKKQRMKKQKRYNRTIMRWFIEPLSKVIIYFTYRIYRTIIFWNQPLNNRIDHVLKVQHPYGIINKK